MAIKSKIKELLGELELDLGIVPWSIAIISLVCLYMFWDDLVSLQIDAHVPLYYPWRFVGLETARNILKVVIFIGGALLIYSSCMVIDKGWTKKTVLLLSFMLSLTSFYTGWWLHPHSSLLRSSERLARAELRYDSLELEIEYAVTEQERSDFEKALPAAKAYYKAEIDSFFDQKARLKRASNYATIGLIATGIILIIVSIILWTSIHLATPHTPVISAADTVTSYNWWKESTCGRTIKVIISVWVYGFMLVMIISLVVVTALMGYGIVLGLGRLLGII